MLLKTIAFFIWGLTCVYCESLTSNEIITDGPVDDTTVLFQIQLVANEVDKYLHLRSTISHGFSFLMSVLIRLFSILDPTDLLQMMVQRVETNISCAACDLLVSLLMHKYFSTSLVLYIAKLVCQIFKIQKSHICHDHIETYRDSVTFMKERQGGLTSTEMCALLIGDSCIDKPTRNVFWTIKISDKRSNDNDDDYESVLKNEYPAKDTNSRNITKFIHITDIHTDPNYAPGSNAACHEPICCHSHHGIPQLDELKAGDWADYRHCDTQPKILDEVLHEISKKHSDAKFWLWTGDSLPHEPWTLTKDIVIKSLQSATDTFIKYKKEGLNIYPALGNHDTSPLNAFSPPGVTDERVSSRWLYESVGEMWSSFLPPSALHTFRKTGSYVVRLQPNLILVNLNTNYCARLNIWTLVDPVDPAGQLKWLVNVLSIAELFEDKVYLMMHIPPDDKECTQAWLYNYMMIIERFSDMIILQVAGHTHYDEFRLYHSLEPWAYIKRLTGLLLITPAVTPYVGNNPAYRLFSSDRETGDVLNYETFTANVTQANHDSVPHFIKSYDAKSYFGMDSVTPYIFNQLIGKFKSDDSSFVDFHNRVYMSNSDYHAIERNGTDGQILKYLIRSIKMFDPFQYQPRNVLDELYTKDLSFVPKSSNDSR